MSLLSWAIRQTETSDNSSEDRHLAFIRTITKYSGLDFTTGFSLLHGERVSHGENVLSHQTKQNTNSIVQGIR